MSSPRSTLDGRRGLTPAAGTGPGLPVPGTLPTAIEVRGARHNNLRDLDVDVPLWRTVAIVGVSGSGKTSLAIGTLYAEGMHRFLEALSTYSRRRLTQAQRPDVDRIGHLPPALALRQRPPVPGPRSTVGTMTEVLNVLRLMMSRLGSHLCPNGHRVEPSVATQGMEIVCPVCGAGFEPPSAESFSFNSYGACPACNGLGVRSEVDVDTLVPDQGKTIEQGAVLPWNAGSRRLYQYAARELGVRLDVPFRELTRREKEIVLHGEPVQRRVTFSSGRSGRPVQLNVTYENAVGTVERALRSDTEVSRGRVRRFLVTRTCSVCHGTRLRPEALTSLLGGRNIAQISALRLDELHSFVAGLPGGLPAELGRLTAGLIGELNGTLTPLLDVGLGYLQLDRSGASLSAGERQRIELTSTVRENTTGMLYVLDEPSVGLHPSNIAGLHTTIAALARNGNSVVIVEHEREIMRTADWIIELGPAAGAHGGTIIAEGTPDEIAADPHSIMGPFLAGTATVRRDRAVPSGPGAADPRAADPGRLTPGRPRTATRSTWRSASSTTCTASRPPFRCTGSPRWRARPGPGRPPSCWTAWSPPPARCSTDRRCPATSAASTSAASARSSRSTPHLSARTPGRRRRPTPAPSTRYAACSPIRPPRGARSGSPGTSPSTLARASARPAAASVISISTCSTCPTSRFGARPATAPASTTRPWPSASTASRSRTSSALPCTTRSPGSVRKA